jgi:DNA polymerase-3 subunit epsilon
MLTFASLDFETANSNPSSICSVGIVIIRDGQLFDSYYSLIQPEPNYYGYYQTRIHGLTCEDTDNARIFPEVWAEIEPMIEGLTLVAHNKSFDERCLKAAFRTYGIDYPDYTFRCTCNMSKKVFPNLPNHQLHTVSEYCGYSLKNHHHALADAEACADIALKVFDKTRLV